MRYLAFSLIAGFAAAPLASSASAQGLYGGAQLGFSAGGGEVDNTGVDLEFDTGLFVNGFIGKNLGSIRLEGELAYRQNNMDDVGGIPVIGEMSSIALMGNFYYDFGAGTGITPYIGVGAGLADIRFESAVKDSDTTFAAQLMLGLAFPVSASTAMTAELRGFAAFPEFKDNVGVPFEQEYSVGSLSVGFRTAF